MDNQNKLITEELLINAKPYTPTLKIKILRNKILKSVQENLITFISCKTGSGKSTIVPKYLYEYLSGKKTNFCVICTEPRSIACNSLSKYVQDKNKNITISSSVKTYLNLKGPNLIFLKESDLLFLIKEDPDLSKCDILIIDEVHERTMKLDLILYYLKHFTLTKTNRERGFKLIFMSATFNTNDIYEYLSSINDQQLTFGFIDQNDLENEEYRENNYEVMYCNTINNALSYGNTKFNEYNMGKLLREITKIVRYEVYLDNYFSKTILVFLPDYKTIYSLYNMLQKEYKGYINVYQFSSALSICEQNDIINELNQLNYYNRKNICNVIIATTLAETCLTFPNCEVVIDCGLKKNNRYNYESNIFEEVIEYISQDSCIQRSGRCGRGKIKGTSYRLFSRESFNLMDKFRKPDIETGNIDLIILKLFETEKISKFSKEEVKSKGYLDFLSKIDKKKYDNIVAKLIKYNAIEKAENNDYFLITNFGFWALKANIDIELGYYFDKFINKYPMEIQKEPVFQLLNAISITDNYNCELFYTDIDTDWFKFSLIDNNKNTKDSKTLIDFSNNISNNIINQGIKKYYKERFKNNFNIINEESKVNEPENNFFKTIDFISPYYSLFSKLDEIYNAKNFFSKNKIFQLGEWVISLYFINQYKLIKCLYHNYYQEIETNGCKKCSTSRYFYCTVYSLNEKYFNKQRGKTKHIRDVLKFVNNENDFLISKYEESTISKWNIIYLNLISGKPNIYISENQIIRYLNEIKLVNFESIMNRLYDGYKKLYIHSN